MGTAPYSHASPTFEVSAAREVLSLTAYLDAKLSAWGRQFCQFSHSLPGKEYERMCSPAGGVTPLTPPLQNFPSWFQAWLCKSQRLNSPLVLRDISSHSCHSGSPWTPCTQGSLLVLCHLLRTEPPCVLSKRSPPGYEPYSQASFTSPFEAGSKFPRPALHSFCGPGCPESEVHCLSLWETRGRFRSVHRTRLTWGCFLASSLSGPSRCLCIPGAFNGILIHACQPVLQKVAADPQRMYGGES